MGWHPVQWLAHEWAPTWRRHRWVFFVWLLGLASFIGTVIAIVTSGWGSHAFYGYLSLSLTVSLIHDLAVRFYDRREMRNRETLGSAR